MSFCSFLSVVMISLLPYVRATVEQTNVPDELTWNFYVAQHKTSRLNTPSNAIQSWCTNVYKWQHDSIVHGGRNASTGTRELVHYLSDQVLQSVHHIGRVKRQVVSSGPKRRRKEIRMLTERELDLYFRAVRAAKANTTTAPNVYEALAEFHTGITSISAHGGCNFFGWHRVYLLMYENMLRAQGPEFAEVTIPYWDSRLEARMEQPTSTVLFTNRFLGTGSGEVSGGILGSGWQTSAGPLIRNIGTDGPPMTDEAIVNVTRMTRMSEICGADSAIESDLEFHHNGIHRWVDGQMAMLQTSPLDPAFWNHHTFVDYVWEAFRINSRRNGVNIETDYPANPTTMGAAELHAPDAALGFAEMTVIDGLSNTFTAEIYEYDPPPTCSVQNPDCGSKYLKCVIFSNNAHCVSRTLAEVLEWENNQVTRTTVAPVTSPPPTACPHPPTTQLYTEHDKPYQNHYCLNGKSDIRQWVYIPVKIIYRRPPEYTSYGSYPIYNGKISKFYDIYAPNVYSNVYQHLKNGQPAKYEKCSEGDKRISSIYIKSVGLSYDGTYKEYAIVDRRIAITVSTAYIAVKNPAKESSLALLQATDSCGRACRPVCKVRNSNIYRPCSGAVRLTSAFPRHYGSDFGNAVMDVWDFTADKSCPQFNNASIFIAFNCDFQTDWFWPSKQPPVQQPVPPENVTRKPVDKATVVPGCDLGYGCVVNKPCAVLSEDGKDTALCPTLQYQCMNSCHMYARCWHGKLHVQQCNRGMRYDPSNLKCVPGVCDYSRSSMRLPREKRQ
uniref:Tyrp-1 n=1 Tax=Sinohyriopsis cumingii TaxID=165450 RepID=A0A1J0KEL5_SINCU|nr:Tyrp-1 [Sinohyriopsis cumingii]